MPDFVPIERIASKIYQIRDIRVMLDRDLADLYGAIKRVYGTALWPSPSKAWLCYQACSIARERFKSIF